MRLVRGLNSAIRLEFLCLYYCKYMKKLLIMSLVFGMYALFSSCTSYYYSTINSTQDLTDNVKDSDGYFHFENDTVRISYSFKGENSPITIRIHNKTKDPLFVDWGKSALIIDGKAISYASGNISGNMDVPYDVNPMLIREYMSQSQNKVSFIPPYTYIEESPLILENFEFKDIPNKAFMKRKFAVDQYESYELRILQYNEETSPLFFSSFMTIVAADEEGKPGVTQSFEQEFYVSRLVKTSLKPSKYPDTAMNRGDTFFVCDYKGRNTGNIIATIAVVGASVTVAAFASGNDYYYY